MANICSGALAIECANKEKLEKILCAFLNENGKISKELDFRDLLDILGIDEDDKDKCDLRGVFYNAELKEMKDYYAVIMDFDCKWSFEPMILEVISKAHKDITFELYEEETGFDIFVNTDVNGKYFTDRYYYNDGNDSYYFASGEENDVIESIKELSFPNAVLNSIDDCVLLNQASRLAGRYDITDEQKEEVIQICLKLFPNTKIEKYSDCPVADENKLFYFNVYEEEI